MKKFKTGNIIKNPYGNVLIFIDYYIGHDGDEMFKWISFDYSNSSGVSHVHAKNKEVQCLCHYDNWVGEITVPDEECEECMGSGRRIEKIYGEEDYKLLASCANEYLKSLLNGALSKLN